MTTAVCVKRLELDEKMKRVELRELDRVLRIDGMKEGGLLTKLAVTLFGTSSGQSVVQILYDFSCGRIEGYSGYKQNVKVRSSQGAWKHVFKEWASNVDVLCKFLDWLVENESVGLNLEDFFEPRDKIMMKFLLVNESFLVPLLDDSNILMDYLYHARPMIEEKLMNLKAGELKKLIREYKRVHEFNGISDWYSQVGKIDKSLTRDLFQRYFTVLFDKVTVSKEIIPELETLFSCEYVEPENKHEVQSIVESGNKNTSGSKVFSFGLNSDGSIDFPNVLLHAKTRHYFLFHVLGLHECQSPLLFSQFKILCSFVDPITQPPPNDIHIISIDLLHELYLGSITPEIMIELPDYSITWKIHLCFNLEKILIAIMKRLNCWDYQKLISIQRESELDPTGYQNRLKEWLPNALNTQDLELLYMVSLISFYSIYKLHSDKPAQLNPFVPLLFKVWKNLTIVIILGLEIDRLEEERASYNTPTLVRAVIRGASAVRALIATILNSHMKEKEHDFKHEPINLFMSPHGRKLCNGALFADVRFHAAAMLPLGVDLNEIIDLLSDLQPGDRIDEDVNYMFDYEYHDYNDFYSSIYEDETLDDEELEEIEQRERIKEMRGYYKRCDCKFNDDDENEDDDEDTNDDQSGDYGWKDYQNDSNGKSNNINEAELEKEDNVDKNTDNLEGELMSMDDNLAIKQHDSSKKKKSSMTSKFDYTVGYDDKGKDWRDIPRALNFYYLDQYIFVSKIHSDVIIYLLREATKKKLEPNHGSFVLRSLATCIKLEQEQHVLESMVSVTSGLEENVLELTGDQFMVKLFDEKLLDAMFYYNNDLAWRILDEMFMSYGNRRLILFHLTHMNLSFSLIHYLYELAMGLRGNCKTPYEHEVAKNKQLDILDNLNIGSSDSGLAVPFSRQGPIVLSEIENKMLLQEFFINAALYFSNNMRDLTGNSDEFESNEVVLPKPWTNDDITSENIEGKEISSHLTGLMEMVCFMVEMLFQHKKFDIADSEYVFELQTLLMNWINVLPEARALFFQLKSRLMESGRSKKKADSNAPEESSELYNQLAPVDLENCELDDGGDDPSGKDLSYYNKMLIRILPPASLEENPAITALRTFISKYSLTRRTPLYGRKVIFTTNTILPMHRTDKETSEREFLAEFGIDYKDVLEMQQQEAEEENDDESM